MKEVLEPLVRIAGVRKVLLVSEDGMPIAVQDAPDSGSTAAAQAGWGSTAEDVDALAGFAVGFLGDMRRSIDPLAWDPPQHVVLRAVHGTLALMRSPGSLLLVILERGMQPEDLRVPMEAAVARVQRVLRRKQAVEPPGPLPGRNSHPRTDPFESERIGSEIPGVAGER